MGEKPFNLETKIRLITLVEKEPDLYDPDKKKSLIWAEIGKKLDEKGDTCKKEWTKLKKSYDHNKISTGKRLSANAELFPRMKFLDIKKPEHPSTSGNQQQNNVWQQQRIEKNGDSGCKTGFRLEATRTGADGETSTGQQTSSLQVNANVGSNNHNDNPQRNLDNSPTPSPKRSTESTQDTSCSFRTNEKQEKNTVKEESELDLFCRQIQKALEELPPDLQILAQAEIFNKVLEYKTRALQKR